MNIYIGNLPYEATQRILWITFEPFGQVRSVKIIKDKYSGNPKGFGFIDMPSEVEAQLAITILNGKDLMGNKLKVNEARPRCGRKRKKKA